MKKVKNKDLKKVTGGVFQLPPQIERREPDHVDLINKPDVPAPKTEKKPNLFGPDTNLKLPK